MAAHRTPAQCPPPAMRLNTFILTLCVCALHARAASIPSEKRIDDLDNVDLDDVVVEPEAIPAPVKDVDNNLRKTVVDIPVKVVEEPTVVDENSNDYIPKDSDNIVVKRIEIDLNNPGPPQRQEHETQNPENYGEVEKALFGIKKSVIDAQKVFNDGFQEVSSSFKTLFGVNEDLPAIHQNLENLKQTFSNQIEIINETIKTKLKPDPVHSDKESEKKLKIAESHLENLKKNFNVGVDTLTEGVEVLTIIKEEDEAAKTKSIISEDGGSVKADGDASSSEKPPAQTTDPISSNPVIQFLQNFQTGMSHAFSNFTTAIQNNFGGAQQSSGSNQGGGNPIINFLQGINVPNFVQAPPSQDSKPEGAQSDTAVTSAPTATTAQWGPQAFFQQVQNTWQNLINPGQNNVQQDTPQTAQPQAAKPPTNNGPIAQAFQNIVQFIQRPGQAAAPQQPASNQPPAQAAASETASGTSNEAQNAVPAQADPVEAAPQKADAVPASPQKAEPAPQAAAQQPVQAGPIQQLVQNNPIIKGIQSAVQRLQGTPNPEAPRSEIIKEDAKVKGHGGNQGDTSCGGSGVAEKIQEIKEENIIPKVSEEILEGEIKSEEAKVASPSDKTEQVVV